MTKEIVYNIGDVVETTKCKGRIILRDRVNPESPIISVLGEWVYMLEDENGKLVGPIKWYEINQQ